MQHISKKLAADFNLFSLNDPETTRFYSANIDFLINNFPYFNDLSLVSSFFCSDNRKFNSKFYTRITKFIEIIRYDADKRGDREVNTLETPSGVARPKTRHMSTEMTIDQVNKSLPSYFAQFLKETDSKPFSLDSDSESDSDPTACKMPTNGKVPNGAIRHPFQETLDSPFDLTSVFEKLRIKDKKSNSLVEIKSDPKFPNHFPEGADFIVNPTSVVMKYYTAVLNFHMGKFIVTPFFINQLIKRCDYEEISDLLCKLVKQGGTLATVAKSSNLREIFWKNLGALEMILESATGCEAEEEMLLDQVFLQRDSLIYRFFEDGIVQGYVDSEVFKDVHLAYPACSSSSDNESGQSIGKDQLQSDLDAEQNELEGKSLPLQADDGVLDCNPADQSNETGKASSEEKKVPCKKNGAKGCQRDSSVGEYGRKSKIEDKNSNSSEVNHIRLWDRNVSHLYRVERSKTPKASIFHSAYSILQAVGTQRTGIDIPELQLKNINRFTVLYYRLLALNSRFSREILVFLQKLMFEQVDCSHLLFSITRILLKVNPVELAEMGFFERLRSSVFLHAHSYNTKGVEHSLFAFLLKIYVKNKNFLQRDYHGYLKKCGGKSIQFIKDSWVAAHLLFDYFLRLEKYGYTPEDEENILEYEGFARYIIDVMASDIPFSTVFTKF